MEEVKQEPIINSVPKKFYYPNRFLDASMKLGFVASIFATIFAFFPLMSAVAFVLWFIIVFVICAFLVVFTLGLILLEEGNIVSALWSTIEGSNFVELSCLVQLYATPVAGGMGIFFSLLALIFSIVSKHNLHKKRNIIMSSIAIGLSILSIAVLIITVNQS